MSQTKSPCSVLVPGSSWNSKKRTIRYQQLCVTIFDNTQIKTSKANKQNKQTNKAKNKNKTNKQTEIPTN